MCRAQTALPRSRRSPRQRNPTLGLSSCTHRGPPTSSRRGGSPSRRRPPGLRRRLRALPAPTNDFLHAASPAFDAPLSRSGALCSMAHGWSWRAAPLALHELCSGSANQGVTTMWLTAGLFHQLRCRSRAAQRASVSWSPAGTSCRTRTCAAPSPRFSTTRIVNGYGPPKGPPFTCCHTVTAAIPERARLPIGRPIRRHARYVPRRPARVVATGVVGELWIAGDGLRAAITAAPRRVRTLRA